MCRRSASAAPAVMVDVTVSPAPEGDPEGYDFSRETDALVIRGVTVSRDGPTVIRLRC